MICKKKIIIIFFYDWLVQLNSKICLNFAMCFIIFASRSEVLYEFWPARERSPFPVVKSQRSPIKFLYTVTRASTLLPSNIDQYSKGSAAAIRHGAVGRYGQTDGKVPSLLRHSWPLPCKDKKWKLGQEGISFTGMTSVSLRSQQALGLLSQGKHDTIPGRKKVQLHNHSVPQTLKMRKALDGCVLWRDEQLPICLKIGQSENAGSGFCATYF